MVIENVLLNPQQFEILKNQQIFHKNNKNKCVSKSKVLNETQIDIRINALSKEKTK